MADRVGQQFGNYRIIRQLGQGGFAEVYLAEHLQLGTLAAIKILQARVTTEEIDAFGKEARTIARLTHPHIIRVLDFDVEGTTPYLVMDYAPNGNMRTLHPKGTRVPLPSIVDYVNQIADALQYAHDGRLIHRDIKPENLLLGQSNEILLSDFGIALLAHSTLSQSRQDVAGTASYMAPEQFQGKPRPASDQYALGIVVYEWLSGTRPFEGTFMEIVSQHLIQPPPPLREKVPSISSEVEQVVMTALAKAPKQRFGSVQAFANALEQASRATPYIPLTPYPEVASPPPSPVATPPERAAVDARADQPLQSIDVPIMQERSTLTPPQQEPYPLEVFTPPRQEQPWEAIAPPPPPRQEQPWESIPPPPPPPWEKPAYEAPFFYAPDIAPERKRIPSTRAALLFGLVVIVILSATGLLYTSSTGLLTHLFTTVQTLGHQGFLHSSTPGPTPVHGGTWTDDLSIAPDSLLPNAGFLNSDFAVEQALYAPLFVGDASGRIKPGIATEIPTVTNGDISADAKTWIFHLRPGLKWSDGQPLNADDVDFSWRLWQDPKYGTYGGGAYYASGYNQISSADVSADKLTITFHLKQAYAPFLSLWVDGSTAPLPKHHFATMAPGAIMQSADGLNPSVVSGPFKMSESIKDKQYTLVRNPNYYRASEGLPYLDKIIFRVIDNNTLLSDLKAGTVISSWNLDIDQIDTYNTIASYKVMTNPASSNFEMMIFNFKNAILGKDPVVRKAIDMAIDHNALIKNARHGLGLELCTDHGSAYDLGYQANAPCPKLDSTAANQLLDQDGWTKGSDGVRTKGGQRLEFSYSTMTTQGWHQADETIIQQNLNAIGVKINLQNYSAADFFGTVLTNGKFDLAEYSNTLSYDPDDSILAACNQTEPNGGSNFGSYCNPSLDQLFTQERSTIDPTARQQIFNQIHQIYLTDFPFIVLYSPQDASIAKSTVHNYLPGPSYGAAETINVWEWWCDNGKC